VIEAVRAALKTIFTTTFGSQAGNFGYPLAQRPSLAMVLIGLAVLGAVLAGLRWSVPRLRTHEGAVIAVWLGLAFAAQLALANLASASLAAIVESRGANGFYVVSLQHSATDLLSRFHEIADTLPLHVRSNLPGKTLFYEGLGLVTSSTRGMAYLILLISNLGGVLVYSLAKRWFNDSLTAFYALVLYLFLPARIYFSPLLNTLTPVLMLLVFWLVTRNTQSRRTADLLCAGIALYTLVIFEPLPLAAMPLLAAFVAIAVARGTLTWTDAFTMTGWIAAAFAFVYVAVQLAFGFDLLSAFRYALADARKFNLGAQRPYSVWVVHNLKDFFLNMGIAQSAVFVAIAWSAVRAWVSSPRESRFSPDVLLPIVFLAVLFALDLSGVNRGETVRLWIFLGVLMQLLVARACALWSQRGRARADLITPVLVFSVVQTTLCIRVVGWIIP
jgi:methylthioxylose transferase